MTNYYVSDNHQFNTTLSATLLKYAAISGSWRQSAGESPKGSPNSTR